MKIYKNLRTFIETLEMSGELKRIRTPVQTCLEMSAIAARAIKEGKPAILFEHPEGFRIPVVMNFLASEKRISMALGKHPEEIGEELINFAEDLFPVGFKKLLRSRAILRRLAGMRTTKRRRRGEAPCQEVRLTPGHDPFGLGKFPVLTCWQGDGGPFVTLPQVLTLDPVSMKRNVGMYRMQVFDSWTTGMHWQIQKGGGFHYHAAEKMGKPLSVAVAIGTDPCLLLATIAPLPEGIDEIGFAGFLRRCPTTMTRAYSIPVDVPAEAEIILEGEVPPFERRVEGPFGDHFGYYSAPSEFPVFHIKTITHRRNPLYAATVVGPPTKEDKFLGDATQMMLSPLLRILHPEIRSLWAYHEAGFHNLLVVSIEERYEKEAVKTSLSLLGEGQMALTKNIIVVSEMIDPRNFDEVAREIGKNFDPETGLVLLDDVPLDTLDFTSFKMNSGGRMIINATRSFSKSAKLSVHAGTASPVRAEIRADLLNQLSDSLKRRDIRLKEYVLIGGAMLIIKTDFPGADVLKNLAQKHEEYFKNFGIKLIVALSSDISFEDREMLLWGIFTRFDCSRDVVFSRVRVEGARIIRSGIMGIDATFKPGYPEVLHVKKEVEEKVERLWDKYWI